jgi:hypothetical protein
MIVIPDSFLHRINRISRTSASVRLKDSKSDCDPDYDTLSYLFSPPSLPASASLYRIWNGFYSFGRSESYFAGGYFDRVVSIDLRKLGKVLVKMTRQVRIIPLSPVDCYWKTFYRCGDDILNPTIQIIFGTIHSRIYHQFQVLSSWIKNDEKDATTTKNCSVSILRCSYYCEGIAVPALLSHIYLSVVKASVYILISISKWNEFSLSS